jgi:hypothetical protein
MTTPADYEIALYTEPDSGLAYGCIAKGRYVFGGHGYGEIGGDLFTRYLAEIASAQHPLAGCNVASAEIVNKIPDDYLTDGKPLSASDFNKVLSALKGK